MFSNAQSIRRNSDHTQSQSNAPTANLRGSATSNRNRGTLASGLNAATEMNIRGRSAVSGKGPVIRQDQYNASPLRYADIDARDHKVSSVLPRHDLLPLSEDIPSDGIIFSRMRSHPESIVVYRTPEERSRNSERLNLDRRQLDACPLLEQEQRLRLLNFQNNNIRVIENLENLPNLIFLDLYNNKVMSLDGCLSTVHGLRVLMAGKNRISVITNLSNLRKLDVLDLHSNDIREIDGLSSLGDLRVLNLAGNRISAVKNLSSLQSLTELNLRRNSIQKVVELDKIPALQRVFLSHNLINSIDDIHCLFSIRFLIELSLDGNPLSERDTPGYRGMIIASIPGLRHLDLKRIAEEERGRPPGRHASKSNSPTLDDGGIALLTSAVGESFVGPVTADGSDTHRDDVSIGMEPIKGKPSPSRRLLARASQKDLYVNTAAPVLGVGDERLAETSPTADTQLHLTRSTATSLPPASVLLTVPRRPSTGLLITPTDSKNGTPLGGRRDSSTPIRGSRSPQPQNLFELEVIGDNEKHLVVVGSGWEWVQSKRMLVHVTEVTLESMPSTVILGKFAANISWLPALRCLRLVGNGLESFDEIRRLSDLFVSIEKLQISGSPVCSLVLLRPFVICCFLGVRNFNDDDISADERQQSQHLFKPLMDCRRMATASSGLPAGTSQSTGSNADKVNSMPPIPSPLTKLKSFGSVRQAAGEIAGVSAFNELRSLAIQRRDLKIAFDEAFGRTVQKLIFESIDEIFEFSPMR